MNRRQLLAAMGVAGAAGALYVLRLPSSGDAGSCVGDAGERPDARRPGDPQLEVDPEVDFGDWIHIGEDGVTVYSGRTEIGQGFRTVLVALVAQGLTVDPGDVEAVLGDTDRCPDDGPTAGSCSTRNVAWRFWLACEAIPLKMVSTMAFVLMAWLIAWRTFLSRNSSRLAMFIAM